MRGQIAQVKWLFEGEPGGFARGVEGLRAGNSASSEGGGLPEASILPVLPALAGLLPGGGLARRAGASAPGAWCGVAGVPSLGVVAAAGMGAEPGRLMLVPEPGPGWPQGVASMLEAREGGRGGAPARRAAGAGPAAAGGSAAARRRSADRGRSLGRGAGPAAGHPAVLGR